MRMPSSRTLSADRSNELGLVRCCLLCVADQTLIILRIRMDYMVIAHKLSACCRFAAGALP
jgi:hypothetical protein